MRLEFVIRTLSPACLVLFLALLLWVVVGRDDSPGFTGNLYQTKAIVTGEREETKLPVLGQCLKDVLKKVSGDPDIDRDSRVEEFARQAQAYVKAFSYRDRMEGIPIHDEQGTRDRPYDLTVDFHPGKIDDILQALGQKPDLRRISRASGGGIVLVGTIAWNKGMLGWKGNWQLQSTDGPHDWQIQNMNFDTAFRSAMRGAAQVLSGHGEPGDEVQ